MAQETIQLQIPFDSLLASVMRLNLTEKRRLWELLNEQMSQIEEEIWERSPTVRSEIREARAAYQAGDYMTIDDYLAKQQGRG